ncbi:ral guanine nucleotide dissociation stimulator-like 1 [Thalassophryne amazonica]|uniref:ral guanine nucleotide dissociation stimulator-like 1 n=1 Tax=Thalassophryne amazonica TaxID=390379 RepID=UPI001471CBCC|nr:ral guanine nucleotide dissociation stimulator-like 1 [Thalassophryne amazonica]
MRKWELTMNPVQEWGEEVEDGAIYGVTLRRDPLPSSPNPHTTSACCAFVQYRTSKVRRLKAATLDLLVDHLLDPCCQEQDYSRIFLSTYRTFTSTTTLLQLLFHRDNAAPHVNKSDYQSPLLAFVQTWLDEYSEDFRDPPLHAALRLLLDHLRISSAVHHNVHSQPNVCSLAGQAEALLKRFQKEDAEPDLSSTQSDLEQDEGCSGDDDSGFENSLDQGNIMDFSALSIAEQLTQLDSALFIKVVPYQCLGCIWSQRDKKENMSPTIRATVAQFNAITNQVITSLLCRPTAATSSPNLSRQLPTTPAQRARIIEKWIQVAQDCRQLKNFSSLRAILSALQSNAVYRLRKTWAAVSRDRMAIFDNLWETFPNENYVLTNRQLLEEDGGQVTVDSMSPKISKWCPIPRHMSSSSGVVPYLGTYLTIFTMLDTALPDTVEGGLINFEKRRREFEILSQIRVLQASCSQYNLPHHTRIAVWLQGHKLLTDEESYELSRQLEPPVDASSPTQWKDRMLSKTLSLLTGNETSKSVPADQISVSSSGSSGSDVEDFSSTCSMRLQSFDSCSDSVPESFSSSSSFSLRSCASSSPDSPGPSSISSSCHTDLTESSVASHHKRSISMTTVPVYNRQVGDLCIIRVSVDLSHYNGNMYKSILLTSQDKTAQVIQRALEKHNLEHMNSQDFTLTQVISQERELLIPDKANVFYAMSTTANFDFLLRHFAKGQRKLLRATCSLGRLMKSGR